MKDFLRNLWHDDRGNTLILAAAVIIPLLGLAGSGIDLSRAYLAKNRLQQACDAGVLAGRKAMSTTVDAKVTGEVRKFVNFNFPQGTLQTANFAIDPTEGANKSVNLTLTTTVPTSIMQLFGFETLPVTASCRGREDFVNTDVMLVLDTTLSMNCAPSDAANTYCSTEKTNAKIKGLRTAVTNFYNTLVPAQTRLQNAGLQLRYAIVPYSMTVNVGKHIRAINTSYIRNPAKYQKCTTKNSSGVCTSTVTYDDVDHNATWFSSWSGCIEERATVNNIGPSSGYNIPTGAKDLDIDTAPTSDVTTKWAPYDPAAATAKYAAYADIASACPKEARRLAAFATSTDLTNWLGTMTAGGYTYHDIGLIWAARLFSRTGLWSADNPTAHNSYPINRHLIFMTDGAMDPDPYAYSAWGVDSYATGGRRISGNGNATTQLNSHVQRFKMLCNRIKGMDSVNPITVWVIAFGTSSGTGLSTELTNCASTPQNAFRAANSADLNSQFQQIGESIGALRLTQ